MSETNINGVFLLREVRERILKDIWPIVPYFRSQNNYGWVVGGRFTNPPTTTVPWGPSTVFSSVERISFSNDTITSSIRGNLSIVRYNHASTGNDNYGWFGGGFTPTTTSLVDRITYLSDTSTALSRGSLTSRSRLAATGNDNYGWFGSGGPSSSEIRRIEFSNDSVASSVRGPLSVSRTDLTATSAEKRTNFGWFTGVTGPATPSPSFYGISIDRITFNNDTVTASVRGQLSLARGRLASRSNQENGWFFGGDNLNVGSYSTVDRISFNNDTDIALIRGPLSIRRLNLAASGNDTYAWISGGYNYPSPSIIVQPSNNERITFSSDTSTASTRGTLNFSRYEISATSGVL
jgi:hypothetical protein